MSSSLDPSRMERPMQVGIFTFAERPRTCRMGPGIVTYRVWAPVVFGQVPRRSYGRRATLWGSSLTIS